jgi:hypothetical protein
MTASFILQKRAALVCWPLVFVTFPFLGIVAPAEATTINFFPLNLITFGSFDSALSIAGSSTDGANFSVSLPPPPIAPDQDVSISTGRTLPNFGSSTRASADISATFGTVRTSAAVLAGIGQTATAVAFAKYGTSLRFSAAPLPGILKLIIDPPFLLDSGTAQSEMAFTATLNGSTIFSADAMLNDGSLITSGAFSPGDFSIQTMGEQTVALLTNDTFSVPFDILPSQVGQAIPFEFDQTFTANAQNGGTAIVDNTPEPSTFLLLASGFMSILLIHALTYCKHMPERDDKKA